MSFIRKKRINLIRAEGKPGKPAKTDKNNRSGRCRIESCSNYATNRHRKLCIYHYVEHIRPNYDPYGYDRHVRTTLDKMDRSLTIQKIETNGCRWDKLENWEIIVEPYAIRIDKLPSRFANNNRGCIDFTIRFSKAIDLPRPSMLLRRILRGYGINNIIIESAVEENDILHVRFHANFRSMTTDIYEILE